MKLSSRTYIPMFVCMTLGKMDLICVKPTVSTPSVVGSKRVTCRAALMRASCQPCAGCERRCAGLRYRETLTPMPIEHGIAGHPRKIPRDERIADTRNAHFRISKVISGLSAPIVAISHVLDQLVMLQRAALKARQFFALRLGVCRCGPANMRNPRWIRRVVCKTRRVSAVFQAIQGWGMAARRGIEPLFPG